VVPSGRAQKDSHVLKRVMRRALRGEARAESPAAGVPRPTPTPAPAKATPLPAQAAPAPTSLQGSIAARLAGGLTQDPRAQVKATSGATAADYGEVQTHTAVDGTAYWGEQDNESARAKADGHALVIDQWECIACGTCVENTDAVFVLPDDAKAVPIRQVGDMGLIQDAIDACPVTCIHWTEEPEEYEQLNDANGQPID